MTYDLSWMENSTNLVDITVGINTMTHGLFGILFLASLFFIILIGFMGREELRKILVLDSLICTIIGALMWGIGIFPIAYLSVPIALLVGSIIYYWASN